MPSTTRDDVEVLLENFKDYVNPEGKHAPWFTLKQINQQFAWEDIPEDTLRVWLSDLVRGRKVDVKENTDGEEVYAWRS